MSLPTAASIKVWPSCALISRTPPSGVMKVTLIVLSRSFKSCSDKRGLLLFHRPFHTLNHRKVIHRLEKRLDRLHLGIGGHVEAAFARNPCTTGTDLIHICRRKIIAHPACGDAFDIIIDPARFRIGVAPRLLEGWREAAVQHEVTNARTGKNVYFTALF